MEKKIHLGIDNFNKLIENNGYYIDKTELLYELVEGTVNEVTLFTRPRRFGKSLMMSMMESFFDIQNAGGPEFDDLKIQQNHPEFCAIWKHQYPTIRITLKDVEGRNFDVAYGMLETVIADVCKKFYPVMEENRGKIDSDDFTVFTRLKAKEAGEEDVRNALRIMTRMLNAVYDKPVILLIDEYDVPLAKAQEHRYYQQMLDVIRGIMGTSLKSNEYLKFAVVTGCLRIPKESVFTGVNNFASYSVLDEVFSGYFGFTHDEVKILLQYYHLEEKIDLIQAWYDGYLFGNTEIYCPWDVMSYVAALRKSGDAMPKPYWENTSGNGAIKAFFELGNDEITDQFETLLNGGSITENVTNALTYEEAYTSVGNLWSILLMTGYVTAVGQAKPEDPDESLRGMELRIPNREIAMIFQKAVADHFRQTVDQNRIRELMDALWNGEEERASELLSDLLFETISYLDYHEDYYHAFMAGIFTGRGYVPQSNKEQGLGRPDVDLRDRRNRRRMLIECKKADSLQRMDFWCDEAIRQIADREYARSTDGFHMVLCYGISFFEKNAKVKLMRGDLFA